MAILEDSAAGPLCTCNQSKVLADDKKNVGRCIKKIEPKTPVRGSPRSKSSQGHVNSRLKEKSDDKKPSNGSKRKRFSDGLENQVSKNDTKVLLVEDIGCRSDLEMGCNNGHARVNDSVMVKETLRVFTTFYVRFVQVIK